MKVIGISASPRKNKCSEFAVKRVLDSIKSNDENIEVELITLSDKTVKPCNACGYCNKHFSCKIENDDFNSIAEKLKDNNVKGLILGSPVYMGGITAQAKAFLDRSVMFRRNNFHFKDMIGAAVTIGGSRNGGQELAIQNIHAAFLIHEMIIVGDGQKTAHFGGIGWERVDGGIENDPVSIGTFDNLGKRVAELVNKIALPT